MGCRRVACDRMPVWRIQAGLLRPFGFSPWETPPSQLKSKCSFSNFSPYCFHIRISLENECNIKNTSPHVAPPSDFVFSWLCISSRKLGGVSVEQSLNKQWDGRKRSSLCLFTPPRRCWLQVKKQSLHSWSIRRKGLHIINLKENWNRTDFKKSFNSSLAASLGP